MDRRQHERYDIQAPVRFSWKDLTDVRQRGKGLLTDISGGGLFVSTPDSPPEGARIRLSVAFRTVFAGAGLVIRGVGAVVRVELPREAEGRLGFAAAIETFSFRSNHKKPGDHETAPKVSKANGAMKAFRSENS